MIAIKYHIIFVILSVRCDVFMHSGLNFCVSDNDNLGGLYLTIGETVGSVMIHEYAEYSSINLPLNYPWNKNTFSWMWG